MSAVSSVDYIGATNEIIQFNTGDTNQTLTIIINQDQLCEDDPNEMFYLNCCVVSGIEPFDVPMFQTIVRINDTLEPECGKGQIFACVEWYLVCVTS